MFHAVILFCNLSAELVVWNNFKKCQICYFDICQSVDFSSVQDFITRFPVVNLSDSNVDVVYDQFTKHQRLSQLPKEVKVKAVLVSVVDDGTGNEKTDHDVMWHELCAMRNVDRRASI